MFIHRRFPMLLRAAAIFALMAAAAAQAQSPITGFRDLNWGAPSERLGELDPPRASPIDELRCHTKKNDTLSFGEATLASIHYCFFRNRFYSFELQALPGKAHFEALKREIIKRYGPPSDDGPFSARWGERNDDVQLTLLSGSGELGALLDVYYSPIGLEVLKAEAAASAKSTKPASNGPPAAAASPAAAGASPTPGASTPGASGAPATPAPPSASSERR